MKAAILTVGTELLFGQVVNTNSAYLSDVLNGLGIDVMYHYTVGDNPQRLRETLESALEHCDLIVTTGGLGPTQDDLTKEVVAETLGDVIEENPECMAALMSYYERNYHMTQRRMTPNNLKQAHMPTRAVILENDQGTAPGFLLRDREGKKAVACLPGPPREMKRMFELRLKPLLEEMREAIIYHRIIRTFGIGESKLETELLPLIDGQDDPTIATYAKEGECTLRIASKRATPGEARAAVEDMISRVSTIIGKYIYSTDDEDLAEVVAKNLIERGITLSCAESCTGGLFASTMTDIPGISKIFQQGMVTYTEEAKIKTLGVPPETIEKYGVVSEETALAMARGLKERTGSDLCVSITGVAGPGGGTPETPVGLAFIGLSYKGEERVVKTFYRNVNRKWNKNYFVLNMLNAVREITKVQHSEQ